MRGPVLRLEPVFHPLVDRPTTVRFTRFYLCRTALGCGCTGIVLLRVSFCKPGGRGGKAAGPLIRDRNLGKDAWCRSFRHGGLPLWGPLISIGHYRGRIRGGTIVRAGKDAWEAAARSVIIAPVSVVDRIRPETHIFLTPQDWASRRFPQRGEGAPRIDREHRRLIVGFNSPSP